MLSLQPIVRHRNYSWDISQCVSHIFEIYCYTYWPSQSRIASAQLDKRSGEGGGGNEPAVSPLTGSPKPLPISSMSDNLTPTYWVPPLIVQVRCGEQPTAAELSVVLG